MKLLRANNENLFDGGVGLRKEAGRAPGTIDGQAGFGIKKDGSTSAIGRRYFGKKRRGKRQLNARVKAKKRVPWGPLH